MAEGTGGMIVNNPSLQKTIIAVFVVTFIYPVNKLEANFQCLGENKTYFDITFHIQVVC